MLELIVLLIVLLAGWFTADLPFVALVKEKVKALVKKVFLKNTED